MTTAEATEFKCLPEDQDEDGFVNIWNIAMTTCEGDQEAARELSGRVLGFLCKHSCDFVVCSANGLQYLDDWFEKDNKILYNWKPGSETVEVIAQHAEVPFKAFVLFLETKKYKPAGNYAPRRIDRVEWFTNVWNAG